MLKCTLCIQTVKNVCVILIFCVETRCTHDGRWRLHKEEVEEESAKDAGYIAGWGSSSTSALQPPRSNCSPAQRKLRKFVCNSLVFSKAAHDSNVQLLLRQRKVYTSLLQYSQEYVLRSTKLFSGADSNTAHRMGTSFHYRLCPCQRFARLKRIWGTINTHKWMKKKYFCFSSSPKIWFTRLKLYILKPKLMKKMAHIYFLIQCVLKWTDKFIKYQLY